MHQPVEMELTPGTKYSWCSCGKSQNQPFCDQKSHIGTGKAPKEFSVSTTRKVWLCMCKQTNTVPYCDGSHNKIKS